MKNLDNQTDFWNGISAEKSFNHQIDWDQLPKFVQKDAAILDYGCGYGRSLDQLWQAGYRNLTGIDPAENMIRRGHTDFPHLRLEMLSEDFFDENKIKFDLVLLFAVLTCVPTNEGQLSMLEKIQNILKPGGILYISDLLLQNDERNVKRYKEYRDLPEIYGVFKLPEGGVFRHHNVEWIRTLTVNFTKLHFQEISVITMNGHTARGFQYLGQKNLQ